MPLRFVDALPSAKVGRPFSGTLSWGAQHIPELMDHPDTWAEITEATTLTKKEITHRAAQINRGQGSWRSSAGGRFRAAVRTEDGKSKLFVRYESVDTSTGVPHAA
jgi:hypothetical protein